MELHKQLQSIQEAYKVVSESDEQRWKELLELHKAFSGWSSPDRARIMLDKNMLNATKREKELLIKHFDSNGKPIPKKENDIK